jgi:nucleoside-triphosphatase THEP1
MFTRATKKQARLRAALYGPPGAGKTFSALSIATGLGERIAVIDTERCSASKYAGQYVFDVCDLDDRSVDSYIRAITAAAQAKYDVLIIDSLSHAWQELLVEVERLAAAKFRGNTWSAWSEGTPKQRRLVDAILSYPGHVIATMRSKIEYVVGEHNGKTAPRRVGLAPEQGKGIEYEFDLLVELSQEHIAHVVKDRSGLAQDRLIEKPGPEFGRELAAWLSDGQPVQQTQPAQPAQPQKQPAQQAETKTAAVNAEIQYHPSLHDPVWGLIPALPRAHSVDMVNQLREWWQGKKAKLPQHVYDYGLRMLATREEELLPEEVKK